jgi:hypothetical protein
VVVASETRKRAGRRDRLRRTVGDGLEQSGRQGDCGRWQADGRRRRCEPLAGDRKGAEREEKLQHELNLRRLMDETCTLVPLVT